AAPAMRSAIALLFGFLDCESIDGTASLAFFFRTRLPTIHVSQPTAAFLRLKTPTRSPYPALRDPQTKKGPRSLRRGAGPRESCREPAGGRGSRRDEGTST